MTSKFKLVKQCLNYSMFYTFLILSCDVKTAVIRMENVRLNIYTVIFLVKKVFYSKKFRYRWLDCMVRHGYNPEYCDMYIEDQAICGRMIWLLAHPLPLSPVSMLSLFLSLPVCRWLSLQTGEGGGDRRGAKLYDLVLSPISLPTSSKPINI
jgi:hypothetical protein